MKESAPTGKKLKKEKDQQIMKKPSTNHTTELYLASTDILPLLTGQEKENGAFGHLAIWRRKLHVPPPLWST